MGGTVRDGAGGLVSRVLPGELASRFEVVAQLPTLGAEADVFHVRDRAAGVERLLKLYRFGLTIDTAALGSLQQLGSAHVVEIVKFGEAGGVWFEVLEWCPHGSLRDLASRGVRLDPIDVIRELARALEALHAANIVHRDVKPDNILVRALDPLKLVLGDFGLVRVIHGTSRHTKGFGSIAYAPPEMDSGEISPAWDWWSVGMIIAEHATGHHPFEVGGQLLPDPQIRSWLTQRSVPLETVTDERIRHLCQGLLTRDRHNRWNHAQILEWLGGRTPSVATDGVTTRPGGQRTRSVYWSGTDHTSPGSLAAALQAHWDEAQQAIYQDRDPVLVRDIEYLCNDCNLSAATRELTTLVRSITDIPLHLARLLIELDPELVPIYRGVNLTRPGLEQTALIIISTLATNPKHALSQGRVLDDIRRHNILTLWRALPGVQHGPATQAAWIAELNELDASIGGIKAHFSPTDNDKTLATSLLLLTVVDTHHSASITKKVQELDTTYAGQQPWWRQLPTTTPSQLLVKMLSHGAAAQQTHTQTKAAEEAARRQAEEKARQVVGARWTPHREDNGFLHFLKFLGIWFVMVLLMYVIIGLVWFAFALSATGRRKRDILMMLIPVWGTVVLIQTLWRYTALNVYWSVRADTVSKSLFS